MGLLKPTDVLYIRQKLNHRIVWNYSVQRSYIFKSFGIHIEVNPRFFEKQALVVPYRGSVSAIPTDAHNKFIIVVG